MPYGADPTTPPQQTATQPAQAPAQPQEGGGGYGNDPTGGSSLGALWRGFVKGFSMAGRPPSMLPGAEAGHQRVESDVNRQAAVAQAAHPLAATTGNIAGNIAATAPLMGGGAGVGLPMRVGLGAARGALGAAATPTQGGGDFWSDKLQQIGIGGLAGAAIPTAGGMLAPALPNVPQMSRGLKTAFPNLANFLFGGEERTIDGFDRSVVAEALRPIGGDVPRNMKAGHGLIDHAAAQLDKAYDQVKPQLTFNGYMGPGAWRTFAPRVQAIADDIPSSDLEAKFRSFVDKKIDTAITKAGGTLDGDGFKQIERELGKLTRSYISSDTYAPLGKAFQDLRDLMRESLLIQNPTVAPVLKQINDSYRSFVRVADAVGPTSQGKFSPDDLLRAIERKEPGDVAGPRGRAMGNGVLQAYAELGQNALAGRPVTPMHVAHALSGGSLASRAGAMVARELAGPVGRGIKTSAPVTSPIAGQQAGRATDRIQASRKVGDLQRRIYEAKRRGDTAETQKLMGELSEAQAGYNKLRPSP